MVKFIYHLVSVILLQMPEVDFREKIELDNISFYTEEQDFLIFHYTVWLHNDLALFNEKTFVEYLKKYNKLSPLKPQLFYAEQYGEQVNVSVYI